MINKLDRWLMQHPPRPDLRGARRFCVELWFFGLKEARGCLFAGLFFIAMFAVPRGGWLGVPRYDLLLVFALYGNPDFMVMLADQMWACF